MVQQSGYTYYTHLLVVTCRTLHESVCVVVPIGGGSTYLQHCLPTVFLHIIIIWNQTALPSRQAIASTTQGLYINEALTSVLAH